MGKKEAKKEKKEQVKANEAKATKKAAAGVAAASDSKAAGSGATDVRLDSTSFFRRLAEKHGLTSDEYLAARTERDWEKLIVAMAGRIFNRLANSEPDESCRANGFR